MATLNKDKYYTLLGRNKGTTFEIVFGDYDKQCVIDERQDMKDSYDNGGYTIYRIICTGDKQSDIVATLENENNILKITF